MNVGRAIRESLAAIIPKDNTVRAVEVLERDYATKLRAVEADYKSSGEDERPALGISGLGARRFGYTEMASGKGTTRQLLNVSWPQVCESAERIWNNPLGEWIVKIVTAHVIGGGIHYTVSIKGEKKQEEKPQKEDPKALAAMDRLDQFWDDPVNGMDRFFPQLVTFLYVYGISVIPAFPRWKREDKGYIGDAIVELGCLDPRSLADVRTNPTNAREVTALEVGPTNDRKIWRIVHSSKEHDNRRVGLLPLEPTDELPKDSKAIGKDEYGVLYDGACLYWRHGNAPFEKIGYPLLMKQVDYLDQADQHFFDIVQRVVALQQFVWDVMVKGAATKDELDRVAKEQGIFNGPPRSGATRFHNENVVWTAVTPQLGMSDITPLSRWILLYILGTAGIPLHWFGEGDNTNRASAESMARPTRKMFEALQDEMKWYIKEMLEYVIDTAVLAKKLPDLPYVVEVEMPQVAVADTAADTMALRTLGDAVQVAITAGVLTVGQAMEIYNGVAQQIGIEVREMTAAEKKEIADKKKKDEEQKAAQLKALSQGQMQGNQGKPIPGQERPVQKPPQEQTESIRDTESLAEEIQELPQWMQDAMRENASAGIAEETARLDRAMANVPEDA